MRKGTFAAALLFLCAIFSMAVASENSPVFSGYVYDYANVISPADEIMINMYAKSVANIEVGQVVVVTVDSLQGMDVEDYALKLFNSWGIGRAGINDGLLILLAPNERCIQMTTGSGIDTQITNEDCGMLLDRYAIPLMEKNEFSTGLLSLTKATCLKLIFERSSLFDDLAMIHDILDVAPVEKLDESDSVLYRISLDAKDKIAAGDAHTVGLKRNGSVVAVGNNKYGQCDVSNWRDIVAIAAGSIHTVGLKEDGTVVAVGDNSFGQCNVNDWNDIVAISAGGHCTVGIKQNGTVVAAGEIYGQFDISNWYDIIDVAVGYTDIIGLKKDGTVIGEGFLSSNAGAFLNEWNNIIDVVAARGSIVGLKEDGTIITPSKTDSEKLSDWKNIKAVAISTTCIVGLMRNNTVVVMYQDNADGQCDVSNWRDIVAIAAGSIHTVGLKEDGTVVAVGDNSFGQCNVNDWNEIGCCLTRK